MSNCVNSDVASLVIKLSEQYPEILLEDHQMIVSTAINTYLTEEGLFDWYKHRKENLLDSKESMVLFRKDPHRFFYLDTNAMMTYNVPELGDLTPAEQRCLDKDPFYPKNWKNRPIGL